MKQAVQQRGGPAVTPQTIACACEASLRADRAETELTGAASQREIDGDSPLLEEAMALAADPAGETPEPRPSLFAGDTLAQSLFALIVFAVVQRAVGFGRSILVCDWLEPDQLGEWDLANRFFVLAAPLTVLGLPGSFGRYLEHYRQRGALRSVLLRTTFVCAGLTLLAVVALLAAPQWIATQVFGRSDRASSVGLLAAGLASVIAYNYLTEMLTALRLVRVSSLVQFANSIAFAALSLLFLAAWRLDAMSIVAAYAGSCLLLVLAALLYLIHGPSALPRDRASISHADMWRKLVPFAAWVWLTNLLYNLFEVIDRYMLLHVGNFDDAQTLIGQYHSAQVVPVLIVSVAGLLAGMILPHLSRDWEAGERQRVSETLNLTLKFVGLFSYAGSVAVLLAAPLLFDVVWGGKYADGLALLPLALASCSWLGLLTVAQMYLWCAERATLGCVALGIGLAANVALNLALIPLYGLPGAVIATMASNLGVLLIVMALNRRLGMRLQGATVITSLLPAALLLGQAVALAIFIIVAFEVWRGSRILNTQERKHVSDVWSEYRLRFRGGRA